MTWFKVDDKLHDHRKIRAAGKAPMGVWVLAGSWSADNLTDGFVPATVLSRWGTRADAKKLVDAGLWHPDEQDGEKGWRFHEWSEFQPTRAQKLAERATKAAAGRAGGVASGRSRREARPKHGASGLVEPPARPGPTAAAAAAGDAPQTPVDDVPIAILAGKLRRYTALAGLRTDKLRDDQADRITALIETHGDQKLVDVAIRTLRRDDPPQTIQAFLAGWESIPKPGAPALQVVQEPCPEPGHTGTTRHCIQCASEQKAANR
ncbi:MAG: hypothetical protein HOV78_11395 [Hamadaea sp.]|nr:hypothetical protein [Hamadaea sp.]